LAFVFDVTCITCLILEASVECCKPKKISRDIRFVQTCDFCSFPSESVLVLVVDAFVSDLNVSYVEYLTLYLHFYIIF